PPANLFGLQLRHTQRQPAAVADSHDRDPLPAASMTLNDVLHRGRDILHRLLRRRPPRYRVVRSMSSVRERVIQLQHDAAQLSERGTYLLPQRPRLQPRRIRQQHYDRRWIHDGRTRQRQPRGTRPALAIGVGEALLLVTLLGRGFRVPPQELDATALVPQVDEIPTRIRTAGHTKRESRTGVVPIDDADMALGKPLAEFRL